MRKPFFRFHGMFDQLETLLALEPTIKIILRDYTHPAYEYCHKYKVDFEFGKELYQALKVIKYIIRIFDQKHAPQQVSSY